MKAMMGFGFFLLFLAGIALVMMQGKQMAQQNMPGGGSGMTGISWQPIVVGSETMPEDSGISVLFEIDGSIQGHGGCNGFSGSLETTDGALGVGPLASTRKACPETIMNRESAFMAALENAKLFEMGKDRLQLLDEDRRLLAELVPEE
jgi:heat shock protein HslJ